MRDTQGNASMTCPAKRLQHVICAVDGNLVLVIDMQYEP